MSLFRLVDRAPLTTDPLAADPLAATPLAADPAATAALAPLLGRPHRLPSFARDHAYHEGEPRLALRRLQGKFQVVNPVVRAPLPPLAAERLRALLAGRAPVGGAARAVALHEPVQPVVRHETRGRAPSTMPGRDILFWAELRHRLVVGPPAAAADPLAAAVARPTAGAPLPWAHVAVLVPDADALRQMVPATAHFYRHVTGRLGGGSLDCYWYLDAWERFHEEGRVIGCISPSLVEHGHVGGATARRPAPPRAPTLDDVLFGDLDALVPTRFAPYTPGFDRRGFVPPGYCLVHYFVTVELAVVEEGVRGVAA